MRPRPIRASITVLAVALSLAVPVVGETPPAAGSACAMNHGQIFLSGFQPLDAGSLFYAGREGSSPSAEIRVTPGCFHLGESAKVQAQYATGIGSAGPSDYNVPDGTTDTICAPDTDGDPSACGGVPTSDTVPLTLLTGGDPEPAVESFTFRLTGRITVDGNPVPSQVAAPGSVPVYVVDADGAPRASLEPGVAYARSESFANILIPVFGAGPTPPASVPYTLAPGPGAPATAGQDYQDLTGGTVSLAGGVGYINIGIVNDKIGEGPETVTIALGGPVDSPASTTFTILDNEESEPPTSRFHHPRHTWRYKKSDYRIREFHVFASDNEGGSGVVAAEIALRRNRKNGTCAWLTLNGWQQKDCQNREWLPTTYDDVGELFYYRMKQLKASVGTRIKDYTAFSRAIDGAENVENEFVQRRNANTFEIKRRRRR